MEAPSDRIRALPIWNGSIDIAPLKGGLSNESWLVSDANGRHVVRFGQDFPFHHVSREREAMAAQAAFEAGLAPAVRYSAPGVIVSAYLDAETLDGEGVRQALVPVAELMRRFHATMPRFVSGPGSIFWVFHVIRDYARILRAGGSRHVGLLGADLALSDEMEAVQLALPIVFGHHDLLPANFLDDGERLWLIDFEYAGFGTAMFDLAGLSSNAGFTPDETLQLLESYFGAKPEPALIQAMTAMQVASLLRETLWAHVSELHLSAPGADYAAYGVENRERLAASLDAYRSRYGKPLA